MVFRTNLNCMRDCNGTNNFIVTEAKCKTLKLSLFKVISMESKQEEEQRQFNEETAAMIDTQQIMGNNETKISRDNGLRRKNRK